MDRTTKRLIVAFGIALVPIVLFFAWHGYLDSRMEGELDALRAAGYPTSGEELNAWYPSPQSQNAADAYLDALGHLVNTTDAFADPSDTAYEDVFPDVDDLLAELEKPSEPDPADLLPVVGAYTMPADTEPLPQANMEAMARFLEANAAAMAKLDAAADISESRYPIDYSRDWDTQMPDYGLMRLGANVLCVRAIYEAERGRSDEAAQSLRSSLALARSLSREPTLITQLVRFAMEAAATTTLERVANRAPLTDEQLAGLMNALRQCEQTDAMERAYVGEIAIYVDIQSYFTSVGAPRRHKAVALCMKLAGLPQWDYAEYIRLNRECIAASKLPYHQRQAACNSIAAELSDLPFYHSGLREAMASPDQVNRCEVRPVAKRRAAEVGLAVMRYRLAEGRLPAKLADVAPRFIDALPDDPFTGKPLKYKVREDGSFVVYSVGDDGKDDGGARENASGKEYEPGSDIPFEVSAPGAAR